MAGSPWDGVAPLWGLELRRLAELGTEAVGTSAVTKRVMTQLEGACDEYMWGWEEEDWWRRPEMRLNMFAKSAGEEIWKAARLETQVRFCLSTKTSCLSEALPPTHVCVDKLTRYNLNAGRALDRLEAEQPRTPYNCKAETR